MDNLQLIQQFLQDNIDKYDFEVLSKPTVSGSKVIFQASIDKITGGNHLSSGWEFNLDDAIQTLVDQIKKSQK